jgi:rhamnulokinase
LCRFAADATGLPVIAGPVEATAIGNIAVQTVATGHLPSLDEARRVIRDSFEVEVFEPANDTLWDDAYNKFQELLD